MAVKRNPAVAGAFYPRENQALDRMVQGFLKEIPDTRNPTPKAIIAPHAGYIYSGPIAATAYARLRGAAKTIKRVVLLGPAHRVAVAGLAASSATSWVTPLGEVPLDQKATAEILNLPQVVTMDEAHEFEHSLEVHLPFLQETLEDFQLIPLVVGEAEPKVVAEVLEKLWGGKETLIVISSDLSHYHEYETARKIDAQTSQAIVNLQPEKIAYDHACGRNPIGGLLYLAKEKGLSCQMIDLRNSGDTAGSKDQVVGYGAYVFQ